MSSPAAKEKFSLKSILDATSFVIAKFAVVPYKSWLLFFSFLPFNVPLIL